MRNSKGRFALKELCKFGHEVRQSDCEDCRASEYRVWNSKYKQRSPARILFENARSRASYYSIPFSITIEDIEAVWPVDNRCPVLGISFQRSKTRAPNFASPSLDRIRPAKGYVPSNIAVISHRANAIKRSETDPEVFRKIAVWLEEHL